VGATGPVGPQGPAGPSDVPSQHWVDDQPTPTSFNDRLPNFVMEITTTYAGRTRSIPQATLVEYCGDVDGCFFTLGMKRWSAGNETETAARNATLFYSAADGHWRTTDDTLGIDGSNGTQHIMNIWNTCFVTDGSYTGFSDLGDSSIGLGLLLWNGFGSPSRSCVLILRD
jgi:hypothetical protein